jgi:hypothetical protein
VLKGDIYEEGRDYNLYREPPKNNRERDPEFAKRALAEHREIFDRLLKNRSGRVAERYNRPPKKMRVLLSQELKKQMTMKIRTINIKIQTALISIVSLNLFLTILIIIRMVVRY